MQEIILDFEKLEVYEAGAILVAVLAYPGSHEDEKREPLHRALCALALRARIETDPDWGNSPQLIKPAYAFCPEREVSKNLQTLKRRLRDRMTAGRMAVAFLQEAVTGTVPKLPKGLKRLSVNQMAELVLEDVGQTEPENVETRIWRPSLPVLHLAAACQVLMQTTEREAGRSIHIGDLIEHRSIIEQVIRVAEDYRPLLAKSARLHIDPNIQVKICLA